MSFQHIDLYNFYEVVCFLLSIRLRSCCYVAVLRNIVIFFKELNMRHLLSAVVLMSASVPAMALPTPVPEPESLALFAIGAAALLFARCRK